MVHCIVLLKLKACAHSGVTRACDGKFFNVQWVAA